MAAQVSIGLNLIIQDGEAERICGESYSHVSFSGHIHSP